MFGFKGGPSGLVDNDYVEITDEFMNAYRKIGRASCRERV